MAWEFLVSTGISLYSNYTGRKSARDLVNNIKPGTDTAARDINRETTRRMGFMQSEQNRIDRLNLPMNVMIANKLSNQADAGADKVGSANMYRGSADAMQEQNIDEMGMQFGEKLTNQVTDARQTQQNILQASYDGKSAYNQIISQANRAGYTQAASNSPWTATGYQTGGN